MKHYLINVTDYIGKRVLHFTDNDEAEKKRTELIAEDDDDYGIEIDMEEIDVPEGTKYYVEHYFVSHMVVPSHEYIASTNYFETLEEIQEALEDYVIEKHEDGEVVLSNTELAWRIDCDKTIEEVWIRDGEYFRIYNLSNEPVELKPSEKLMKIIEEDKKKLQEYIV